MAACRLQFRETVMKTFTAKPPIFKKPLADNLISDDHINIIGASPNPPLPPALFRTFQRPPLCTVHDSHHYFARP